jgi:DNA-binding GntR family transcriptional regulator
MKRVGHPNGTIDPISNPQDIERIRSILAERPRDRLLFELAVHSGAKLNDMLNLKVTDLRQAFTGRASSTYNSALFENMDAVGPVREAFERCCAEKEMTEDDFLFQSRKGGGPLRPSSASLLINRWYKEAGLLGLSGATSLRKTHSLLSRTQDDEVNGSVLRPINSTTLQEQVQDQLLQAIISGRLRPGQRIVIEKMAKNMHVSPMPIRDALARLEAIGIVSTTAKRAWIVNTLTPQEHKDLVEIRILLEAKAAEAACQANDEDFLGRLEEIHAQYIRSGLDQNQRETIRLNREFHFTIYRQAGKPILLNVIENLWNRASPYLYIMFQRLTFPDYPIQTFVSTHRKIIDSLRLGDANSVADRLVLDLKSGFDWVRNAFERWGDKENTNGNNDNELNKR